MENNPLNIINKIIKNKPANLRDLNTLIDYSYRRDDMLSTPFIEVSTGLPKKLNQKIKEIEARFPLPGNSTGEIFIKLTLNDEVGISKKMIKNQFGSDMELVVARPNQKVDVFNYWVYLLNDAKVSFGFPHSGPDLLKVVIIKYQ